MRQALCGSAPGRLEPAAAGCLRQQEEAQAVAGGGQGDAGQDEWCILGLSQLAPDMNAQGDGWTRECEEMRFKEATSLLLLLVSAARVGGRPLAVSS